MHYQLPKIFCFISEYEEKGADFLFTSHKNGWPLGSAVELISVKVIKEIAENNRDYPRALQYKILEMQAARWHKTNSIGPLTLEFFFWLTSDYGQSVARPIMGLFALWLAFAGFYTGLSNTACSMCIGDKISSALTFSAGQMLPFVPSAREARLGWEKVLFLGDRLPGCIYALTFTQSIMAVGLLFLLGLALRNRFKL